VQQGSVERKRIDVYYADAVRQARQLVADARALGARATLARAHATALRDTSRHLCNACDMFPHQQPIRRARV